MNYWLVVQWNTDATAYDVLASDVEPDLDEVEAWLRARGDYDEEHPLEFWIEETALTQWKEKERGPLPGL